MGGVAIHLVTTKRTFVMIFAILMKIHRRGQSDSEEEKDRKNGQRSKKFMWQSSYHARIIYEKNEFCQEYYIADALEKMPKNALDCMLYEFTGKSAACAALASLKTILPGKISETCGKKKKFFRGE